MKGPHRVKLSQNKKKQKKEFEKKVAKDMQIQMKILGGILD